MVLTKPLGHFLKIMFCLGENGSYSCYAKNRAGTGSTNFSLSVANDAGEVSGFLEIGLDHLVIFRKIIHLFDHKFPRNSCF